MKETRFKFVQQLPYGLHDMVVKKIEADEKNVRLIFRDGIVKLEEPYPIVKGNIEITDVDFDFAVVTLMSRFGKFGGFRGEKLELTDFLRKYPEFELEIVDEMFSYNQVWFGGYISIPGKWMMRECEISLYYTGEIVYNTEG